MSGACGRAAAPAPDDRERARRGLAQQQAPADAPWPLAWCWLKLIISQAPPQLRLTGHVLKAGHPVGGSLAEQLGQLELAQELAHLGDWRVDLRQGEITGSDNACHIHGCRVGSATPTLDGMIDMYPEDDRRAVRAQVDAAIERGLQFSFHARIAGLDGVCRAAAAHGGRWWTNPASSAPCSAWSFARLIRLSTRPGGRAGSSDRRAGHPLRLPPAGAQAAMCLSRTSKPPPAGSGRRR